MLPLAAVFDRAALDRLATAYPLSPVVLRHALTAHPLLSADALRDAASRMERAHVEARAAATAAGGPFGDLYNKETATGWTMLRFIDQLPEYRTLLASILDELRPVTGPTTGATHEVRGFAFVSAPRAITPYHFDPEYNLLFQISGTKQFAVHPAAPPCLPGTAHHALHIGGDNILNWDESLSTHATVYDLTPGDVLFVPYKCPHWVGVGNEPSVSLSLTWQSDWTRAQRDAHRLNARLARYGYDAPVLPAWPQSPAVRAFAGRVLDRLGVA